MSGKLLTSIRGVKPQVVGNMNCLAFWSVIWVLIVTVLPQVVFAQVGFTPRIVARDLTKPVAAAALPVEDGRKRLLVAEKKGFLKIVDVESGSAKQVVKFGEDVPGEVITILDIAVHRNFEKNRQAFVSYTLDIDNTTCFYRLEMVGVPESYVVDGPKIGRELINESQPCGSASGGGLSWGPDDQLFVGVGVGREVIGKKTAQDTGSILGKVLRIAVDMEDPYGVPEDNPYIDSVSASELVWAIGFRDPYRLSYDPGSKKVYVVDRGTGLTEEVNLAVAKGNYGWPMFEGKECQMMRFDCLGKRFRSPVYTSPGRNGSLTGGHVIAKAGGPFSGRFLFAQSKTGTLIGIPLGKGGKRVKVPLKFSVSSISLTPEGVIYLLDEKSGMIRRLN